VPCGSGDVWIVDRDQGDLASHDEVTGG